MASVSWHGSMSDGESIAATAISPMSNAMPTATWTINLMGKG